MRSFHRAGGLNGKSQVIHPSRGRMTWDVVGQLQTVYCSFVAQRACAARWAIAFLRSGDNFAARAFPPFVPPSLPNATAAGFFFRSLTGNGMGLLTSIASDAPIAASTTRRAFWATSPLLDRLCIQAYDCTRLMPKLVPIIFKMRHYQTRMFSGTRINGLGKNEGLGRRWPLN